MIDGNTIYGVDEAFSRYLRSGITGQLRMNPAFANLGLKELLPMKLNIPDEGCIRSNSSQYCFESGLSIYLFIFYFVSFMYWLLTFSLIQISMVYDIFQEKSA